ncbi:MAG: hypothetical protein AB1894_12440 [Chloroflexota bacterium]
MLDRNARRTLSRRFAYGSFLFCLAVSFTILLFSPITPSLASVIFPVRVWQPHRLQPAPAPDFTNGQRNLLLILTGQSQSGSPLLQGLWVVLQSPSKAEFTFIPLYPLPQPELAATFDLQPGGLPSQEFIQSIQPTDLWWDFYIVLDDVTLSELVDLMYADNPVQNPLAGWQFTDPNIAQLSPQAALEQQTLVLQALCSGAPAFLQRADPGVTLGRLADGLHTNLVADRLVYRWRRLQALGSTLSCKFPLLPGLQSPTALR